MKASKPLSKAALEIVNDINASFRNTKEKDYFCPLAMFLQNYLVKKNMYHGFGMFNEREKDGVKYIVGASKGEDYDFIQFYISRDFRLS